MRHRNHFAAWGLLAVLACLGPAALAQDDPVAPIGDDEEKKKMPFALYVEAAGGAGKTKDPLTSSIAGSSGASFGQTFVELTDVQHARAAIGWRFPEGKGDIRLKFRGHKETSYELQGIGLSKNVLDPGGTATQQASFDVPWWEMSIKDGQLVSRRHPAEWSSATDDTNGNSTPDPGEVRCGIAGYGCNPTGAPAVDQVVTRAVADNLKNQIQTVDIVYGREFGRRRFTSHWWAGLRYFEYAGQLVGGAWLVDSATTAGAGYSSGDLFPMLRITQASSGIGPTGSWEVDVNFFNRGLVLYILGEAAFLAATVEADSNNFFTASQGFQVPARITEDRDKSQWQTGLEAGVRVGFKNGLRFEAAFSRTGYLDAILFPFFNLGVPESEFQSFGGAGLGTQDIVLDSFHVGASFQF